ncbi:MAG: EAL domain-containing protein [Succinivibrionaceae bacterium]|nr:EAL domain-containing protein [Succinivibrionaceae bacterium]
MKLKRALGAPMAVQHAIRLVSLAICAATLAHLAAAWERESEPCALAPSDIFDLALIRLASSETMQTPHEAKATDHPRLVCGDSCRIVFPRQNGGPYEATLEDLNRALEFFPLRAFAAVVETSDGKLGDPETRIYESSHRIFAGSRKLPAPEKTDGEITIRQALEQACGCPGECRAELVQSRILEPVEPQISLALLTRQPSLPSFLLHHGAAAALLALCLSLSLFISLRIYAGVRDAARILKKRVTFNPSFTIRDELSYLRLRAAESNRISEQHQSMIRYLKNQLSKYSTRDPATGLPLEQQFCQEASSRLLNLNPNEFSAMALVSVSPSALTDVRRQILTEEISAEVHTTLHRLAGDQDVMGLDRERNLALFIYNRRSDEAALQILRDAMADIARRHATDTAPGKQLIHGGLAFQTSPDENAADLLEQARCALHTAQGTFSSQPVVYSGKKIDSGRGRNEKYAARFRSDFEQKRISAMFRPVFSAETGACTALMCIPQWKLDDDTTLTGGELYQAVEHQGIQRQIFCMLAEEGIKTMRRIDQANAHSCTFIVFSMTAMLLRDPQIFAYLDQLTLKHTLMNSRIVFAVSDDVLADDSWNRKEVLENLGEKDFRLSLEFINSLDRAEELLECSQCDVVAISCELANPDPDDAPLMDRLRLIRRHADATGRALAFTDIPDAQTMERIRDETCPTYIAGDALAPLMDREAAVAMAQESADSGDEEYS